MALSGSTVWEVRTTGSDINGGGFVTGQVGADFSQQDSANATNQGTTTLSAAISSTGATSCTVTDASALYGAAQALLANPLVGDWIKVDSEIMKVTAVSTNTLTITRAQLGTSAATHSNGATVTNVSNVSTTDLGTAGSTTITSAAAFFSANVVGNVIYVAGGSATITAGWYQITAVGVSGANTTATVDRLTGLTTGTGATVNIGGCLASPGQCAALFTGGQVWIKTGTYSIITASTNVSGGCIALTVSNLLQNSWQGYAVTRGDMGTPPVFQASGISTATIISLTGNNLFINIVLDGASLTAIKGWSLGNANMSRNIGAKNCTNGGITASTATAVYSSWATNCSNGFLQVVCIACVSYGNTVGFNNCGSVYFCISRANTSQGFVATFNCYCCVAYSNGSDGFTIAGSSVIYCNCVAEGNGGYGFNVPSNRSSQTLINCAGYNNVSGNTTAISSYQQDIAINFVAYAATAFVNASAGNFALNNGNGLYAKSAVISNGGTSGTYAVNDVLTVSGGTGTAAKFVVLTVSAGKVATVGLASAGSYTASPANAASTTGGGGSGCTLTITYSPGQGASLRGAGTPGIFPDGLTTGYLDIGAAQHQDSPAFVMARAAERPFADEPTQEPRRVTLISPQPHAVFYRKQSDAPEPEPAAMRRTVIVSHASNPVLVRRPVVYEDSESMIVTKRTSVFTPATIILPTPVFYRRQSPADDLEAQRPVNRISVFLPPSIVLPTPVITTRKTQDLPEDVAFLAVKRAVFVPAPSSSSQPIINTIRNQYFFDNEES